MAYIFIISRMILRLKNLRARSESKVLWSTSVRPRDGVFPGRRAAVTCYIGKHSCWTGWFRRESVPEIKNNNYRQCYLEGVRWLDRLLMDVRLFFWLSIWLFGGYISFVDWLLMSVYFDKPRLKGINALTGQAALICKDRNTAAGEFHKTGNWSLLQGEEELNKRLKQKIHI